MEPEPKISVSDPDPGGSSGSGSRFFAGSGSEFDEYGSEALSKLNNFGSATLIKNLIA